MRSKTSLRAAVDRRDIRLALAFCGLTVAALGCGFSTQLGSGSGGSKTEATTKKSPTPPATTDVETKPKTYTEEIEAWRARRTRNLTSDTGWLTVAGLFWLKEGENTFGTASTNDIVLPPGSAPERAGVFVHEGTRTTIRANPGTRLVWRDKPIEQLTMRSDAADTTDIVELQNLRFFVIRRGGRDAIRMRDLQSATRREFHGIESYPIDPAFRVEAAFEPYVPVKRIPIANIIGIVDSMECPGVLVFELGGKTLRLDPLLEAPDDTSLFLIFKDQTSGEETYGAGRFLYIDMPKDGQAVIDFNKAYNPPCAFTAFATCPLPPVQNELPVAVTAGEKNYAGGH